MKLEDIKQQIDDYFDKITSEEIIKQFEELGYEFENIEENANSFIRL
jgi:hypothetical protein